VRPPLPPPPPLLIRLRPGTQPFGPLNLLVRSPVLIPRPETENWVIRLSETLRPTAQTPLSLLDLGTGSGCIPLLLCHLWPQGSLHAHGVDISTHAIRLANDNALLSGIPSTSDGAHPQNTFRTTLANLLSPNFPQDISPIKPPFNILTSNPPYIPWNDFVKLPRSVSDFEDPRALFGGPDGLEFYEAIARLIAREGFLSPDGVVALEVGRGQSKAVEALIRTTGRVRHTQIWTDPWGIERAIFGRL
jgi:HemK-like putative methylase